MAESDVLIAVGRILADGKEYLHGAEVRVADHAAPVIAQLRRLGVLRLRAEALPATAVEAVLASKDDEIAALKAELKAQLALLQEARAAGAGGAQGAAVVAEVEAQVAQAEAEQSAAAAKKPAAK